MGSRRRTFWALRLPAHRRQSGREWRFQPRHSERRLRLELRESNGVKPLLDPSDFRQGQRSLSLTFEGPGINDAGIQQLIPVHGATTYDFSAYYKSAEFQGAGGPQIVLRDAYTGAPIYASDTLNDADFWKEVHSKVTTPDSTNLLLLAIERFPAGSPIRGKLWLNDFELSPGTFSREFIRRFVSHFGRGLIRHCKGTTVSSALATQPEPAPVVKRFASKITNNALLGSACSRLVGGATRVWSGRALVDFCVGSLLHACCSWRGRAGNG